MLEKHVLNCSPIFLFSLNSLYNVVMALKQGTKVVPYEETKLTKLLQVYAFNKTEGL